VQLTHAAGSCVGVAQSLTRVGNMTLAPVTASPTSIVGGLIHGDYSLVLQFDGESFTPRVCDTVCRTAPVQVWQLTLGGLGAGNAVLFECSSSEFDSSTAQTSIVLRSAMSDLRRVGEGADDTHSLTHDHSNLTNTGFVYYRLSAVDNSTWFSVCSLRVSAIVQQDYLPIMSAMCKCVAGLACVCECAVCVMTYHKSQLCTRA
jgi:hypothetical protein